MKCTAHILREYKHTKAEPIWPMYASSGIWIENPDAKNYPICNGEVTIKLKAIDEPDWGDHFAKLEVEEVCSRCKFPFYPNKPLVEDGIHTYGGFDITKLLENYD